MNIHFYDIESLTNVFTLANYKSKENEIDIYYLCDSPELTTSPSFKEDVTNLIYEKNKNFRGIINLFDLHEEESNKRLAKNFGLSNAVLINDKNNKSDYDDEFRLVCDTDDDYNDDIHPYLMGYNSFQYDMTMLSNYLYETFTKKTLKDRIVEESISAKEAYMLAYNAGKHDITNNTMTTLPFTIQTNQGLAKIDYAPNRPKGEEFFKTYAERTLRSDIHPPTAKFIREFNDTLFSTEFKKYMVGRLRNVWCPHTKRFIFENNADPAKIHNAMRMSGRHIDVAQLNEKQKFVGLKRILGQLGLQILESENLSSNKTTIKTKEELYDLLAYNVSDVVNLEQLFYHPAYKSQFDLKKGLIERYPDIVYKKKEDSYKPDIRPEKADYKRLTIDSTSAKFASRTLCPYGELKDIPAVSFMYPSKEISEEHNIPRVNVLEESKKFFYENFTDPAVREKFNTIYDYYKQIEGTNLNDGTAYEQHYANTPEYVTPSELKDIQKVHNNIPYYDKDQRPTSCFVTFSTGGVHGQEFNKELYESFEKEYETIKYHIESAKAIYPDPLDAKAAKEITLPCGETILASKVLKSGKAEYKDPERSKIDLFQESKDGSTSLHKKLLYTSHGEVIHEDFESYYPLMLVNLNAFYNNDLGYDRYYEMFLDKERFDKMRKDKTLTQSERVYYNLMREGTKLILNAASGAGATTYDHGIRVNNLIMSMRIIGQLFSWRVGQAQTIAGAKIISTNTDGLYSILDAETNNKILAEQAKIINVNIEPEPMYLVSKDSNNRLELSTDLKTIFGASGGTLSCYNGPTPSQSLSHSAIEDWVLMEYLKRVASNEVSIFEEFNRNLGHKILSEAKSRFTQKKYLTMFQNVIASSHGSMRYIFARCPSTNTTRILQHYNRIFILKDNSPQTSYIEVASASVITAPTKKKRERNDERMIQHDDEALGLLEKNGIKMVDIPIEREATIRKVPRIENNWHIHIQNKDLNYLSQDEADLIINNLDYEKYLNSIEDSFNTNWRNLIPEKEII